MASGCERLLFSSCADLVSCFCVEPCRVFQHQLACACRDDRTHDLARQVALVMHLCKSRLRQCVQHRRFAGVALADQRRSAAVLFHESLL